MTTTAIFSVTHWTAGQSQPEVPVNDGLNIFDAGIAGAFTINASADSDQTIPVTGSKPQGWQYSRIILTDTSAVWSGAHNVIVPTNAKNYIFTNNASTGYDATIKTAVGSGVTCGYGNTVYVRCDGSVVVEDVINMNSVFTGLTDTPASFAGASGLTVQVNASGNALVFASATSGAAAFSTLTDTPASYSSASSQIVAVNASADGLVYGAIFTQLTDTPASYAGASGLAVQVNASGNALVFATAVVSAFNSIDIGFTVGGQPTASQEVLRLPMVRAISFPPDMTGSQAIAKTAATASALFTFNKNGTPFANLYFSATTLGVFSATATTTFSASDQLTVVAPASVESTLADIGIMITGTRD